MYRTDKIIDTELLYILDNLREEDKIECEVLRGPDWKDKLFNDLISSSSKFLLAKTKKDDTPVLIAGAWPTDKNTPQIACVWLLSTPEIENHKICFLKEMKKEIQKYDEKFSLLYNQIYVKNKLAKSWLKWAGFRFPKSEKKLKLLDKEFLKIETPENFEMFYRERPVKGLGE